MSFLPLGKEEGNLALTSCGFGPTSHSQLATFVCLHVLAGCKPACEWMRETLLSCILSVCSSMKESCPAVSPTTFSSAHLHVQPYIHNKWNKKCAHLNYQTSLIPNIAGALLCMHVRPHKHMPSVCMCACMSVYSSYGFLESVCRFFFNDIGF